MLRLYFDENFPLELARQLQRRGLDVLTAHEAGNLGLSDEEHLAYATDQGRVLLSHDQDFVDITRRWFRSRRDHAGVIIAREYRRNDLRVLLALCLNLVESETPESMANAVYPLEQYR